MLASAFRAVARPAVSAARSSLKPATAVRSFSVTARAQSGPPPPQLYGTGAKPGTVPTDVEQATGLERLQLLGDMEGVSVFDDQPLDASRLGTKADPIKVLAYVRIP
jgi:cytochrome c oxidase subunit 5b